MGVEELCLTWDDHHKTLIGVFEALLESSTLVDCTIAAEGQYLKAHKVVLSACSPYFEMLFTQENEKNPIVVLKDIKFQDLKALIDFIYRGRVQIPEDRLGDFTDAAESLQIKGLGGGQRRNNPEKKGRETPNLLKKDSLVSSLAKKRLRNSFPVTGENSEKAGSSSLIPAHKNPRYENTPQIQKADCMQPVFSSAASDSSSVKVQKEPSEVRSSRLSVPVNESDLEPMAEIFLPETLVEPKSEVCLDETTVIGSEDGEEDTTVEEGADYEESGNSGFSSTPGLMKQESSDSFLLDQVVEHSNAGADEEDLQSEKYGIRVAALGNLAQTHLAPASDGDSSIAGAIFDPFQRGGAGDAAASSSTACSCPQCGLIFPTLFALDHHLQSHHARDSPLRCLECGRTFLIPAHLRTHIYKHRGERPFKCEDCDKAFFTKGDLGVHRRIHTGEKPFQCQYCRMSFRKSSGFHRHMRTMHTGMPVEKIPRRRGRLPKNY